MKKKGLIAVLSIALFLFVAQPCRAVRIDYIGGNLYAEAGTDYPGAPGPVFDTNWFNVGELTYSYGPQPGVTYSHAQATGTGLVAHSGDNNVRFMFNTSAQSNTYNSGQSFTTYSIVGTENLLEFEIVAETPLEDDWAVNVEADANILGTLNSGGIWPSEAGTSSLDFEIKIFKDPFDSSVLSGSFSESFQSDLTLDGSDPPFHVPEEMLEVEGELLLEDKWSPINEGSFRTGDHFYLYFRQIVQAYVPTDENSFSKAYNVQSINDVTIQLSANRYRTLPVPEPSIILLLGSLIIGLAVFERRRYKNK